MLTRGPEREIEETATGARAEQTEWANEPRSHPTGSSPNRSPPRGPMTSIVVIGRESDVCCQLVRARLAADGRECLFVPEDELLPGLHFAWRISGDESEGTVGMGSRPIPFSDLGGVLARAWGIPVSVSSFQTKDGQYITSEWSALLLAWLHRLPCPVINRLRPELWYKTHLHVPEIVALAPGVPFKWPAVRVTTSADEARDFYHRCRGRVRYWPLTQHVPYPVETAADLDKLATLAATLPLYLTEAVAGERRDAYVVGPHVVPVAMDGGRAEALPAPVARRCRDIAHALDLTFCMLSLVATGGGDWYGVRLDRMPSLIEVGEEARQEIAGDLVVALTGSAA